MLSVNFSIQPDNSTKITGFHIFMEFLSFMTNHSPKKKKGR